MLDPGEPNVSYICSRYYRAPELIFSTSDYTNAIDIWSAGCVMAELLLSHPLFAGESGVDQLVEIIKILGLSPPPHFNPPLTQEYNLTLLPSRSGTPTSVEVRAMNPDCTDYLSFPFLKKQPWGRIFPLGTPDLALELIEKMLVYTPHHRVLPFQACSHPFFDELRSLSCGDGVGGIPQDIKNLSLPNLFNFSVHELNIARKQGFLARLLPFSGVENGSLPIVTQELNQSD
eukprot:TRINITY_DN6504_c1_g1_i8.p1 TRINITY_DN6504_c1_g1~~TRINITY_DN6504_c1_g1_i8.p1  ORF type:complete len:231 (+),score=42.35 TRINITY_DN6504_c1_g1_i8:698-1390(+)